LSFSFLLNVEFSEIIAGFY